MNTPLACIAICLALATGKAAFGGVTLTMSDEGNKRPNTMLIEGNKIRIESGDSERTVAIFDGDAQKLITINPAKKTYAEMTKQSMNAMQVDAKRKMEEAVAKMSPEQKKQMEQAMAKMSPEQRKQLEMMTGGKSVPSQDKPEKKKIPQISWEPVGGSQTIAGYPCRGFKVMADGKLSGTGCYIAWGEGAITKSDLAPVVKMSEFFSGIAGGDSRDAIGKTLGQLEKLPGFPGVWLDASGGGGNSKQTLTSVKRGSISADKFQPPPGYTMVRLGQQ